MLTGGVSVALNQTLFNFIIATLMPEESRTTGMAVAVFGGIASYLLLWSQQHGLLWLFAGYAAALCALPASSCIASHRVEPRGYIGN